MNCKGFLDENKEIQRTLLDYIENEGINDEYFQNLLTVLNYKNIQNDKHKLSMMLHLIAEIGNNHSRGPYFFEKIEKVLLILIKDIKKYFSNSEVFNIFKCNKRILLFLNEQKIIIFDKYVIKKITSDKYYKKDYPYYFQPEIKPFLEETWLLKKYWINEIKKELPDNFDEKRKEGENDEYICALIRNDSVESFGQ